MDLLQKTGIEPRFHKAIIDDIGKLVQVYQGLKPNNFAGQPNHFLVLQGMIPIFLNKQPYNLPVNITLPPEFPRRPPFVQIIPNNNFRFSNAQYFLQNGYVNVQMVFAWGNNGCALAQFVKGICDVFSANPPIVANSNLPPVNLEVVKNEIYNNCLQVTSAANNSIQKINEMAIEKELMAHFLQVQQRVYKEQLAELSEMQNKLNEMRNPDLIVVPIDPAIEQEAKKKSLLDSHNQVLAAIRMAIREGVVPLDKVIEQSKAYNSQYFSAAVFPLLKEAPSS